VSARWWLRRARWSVAVVAGVWAVALAGSLAGRWRLGAGWITLAVGSMAALVAVGVWVRWQRERAVREAPLPQFLKRKLREAYPTLSGKDADLVERGLRQFFLACLRGHGAFVAMPSRAVDTMWHEFILHTRGYRDWCELALGRFVHHTPAEVLGGDAKRNDGLRRAWYWACRDEAIDPRAPSRLPLLFALDAKLAIPGGFSYRPDCRDIARKSAAGGDGTGTYCATSFADGSYGGDAEGFGGCDASGSEGGSGDGGGDGGGCGGD
jgi:hypothetical protein